MAIYGSWESIFQMETPILINPVQKKWHKQDIYGDLGLATANFAEIFLIEKVDFFMVLPLGIRTWTILDFYEPRKNDAARSLKSKSENHVYSSSIFTTYEII